jgi:alpha-L-arabinofuranosidase
MGAVNYVDVAGIYQADTGKTALFLLNRDLAKPHEVQIVWEGSSPRPGESLILTGADLKATNTFDSPNRVLPQKGEQPSNTAGRTTFELPPRSYTVVQWTA